jgi:hypothetical protein
MAQATAQGREVGESERDGSAEEELAVATRVISRQLSEKGRGRRCPQGRRCTGQWRVQ